MRVYTRARIGYAKESLDWMEGHAVIYRNIVSVVRLRVQSISRDVRSFRPFPITHVEFLSFFLSFFLSPPPFLFFFISSIRVVASIRSSSGVRLRHRYQFPLFI